MLRLSWIHAPTHACPSIRQGVANAAYAISSRREPVVATPENLAFTHKTNVESFLTLANTAFASAERLAALNLNTARAFLEDAMTSAKAVLGVKDMQQLASLQTTLAQPVVERFAAYSRGINEIAAQAQDEVSKIVDAQFAEVSRTLASALDEAAKNAPSGSELAFAAAKSAFAAANSAYERISNATRQIVEVAEENLAAATNATVKAPGAIGKAKKVA